MGASDNNPATQFRESHLAHPPRREDLAGHDLSRRTETLGAASLRFLSEQVSGFGEGATSGDADTS